MWKNHHRRPTSSPTSQFAVKKKGFQKSHVTLPDDDVCRPRIFHQSNTNKKFQPRHLTNQNTTGTICLPTPTYGTRYSYVYIILVYYVCAVLSTRRHPAHPVPVLIHHLSNREIQALWSQNYDTAKLHRCVIQGVDNAMSCNSIFSTGYDRHNIHTHTSNPDVYTNCTPWTIGSKSINRQSIGSYSNRSIVLLVIGIDWLLRPTMSIDWHLHWSVRPIL